VHAEVEPEPTVIWRHPLPDGREAAVADARLCLRAPGKPLCGDGYCYATPMSAVLSAALWIEGACTREPDGWTRHLATGRNRRDGVPGRDERAWVCPRHPDRLPSLEGGRLFCPSCRRDVADAVQVPWPAGRGVTRLRPPRAARRAG
jgi:hypothetical protein